MEGVLPASQIRQPGGGDSRRLGRKETGGEHRASAESSKLQKRLSMGIGGLSPLNLGPSGVISILKT